MNDLLGIVGTYVLLCLERVPVPAPISDLCQRRQLPYQCRLGMAVTMGVYVASSLGSLRSLNPGHNSVCNLWAVSLSQVPILTRSISWGVLGAAAIMVIFYPHLKHQS